MGLHQDIAGYFQLSEVLGEFFIRVNQRFTLTPIPDTMLHKYRQ